MKDIKIFVTANAFSTSITQNSVTFIQVDIPSKSHLIHVSMEPREEISIQFRPKI